MIAERVGLDRRTVSQALSGRPGLAPTTRQKILDAAQQMGYRPNFTARAIRTGQQQRIGLLSSTEDQFSHLPPERLQGMQQTAFKHGFGFSLLSLPDQQINDFKTLSEAIGDFGVGGVLLNYGNGTTNNVVQMLSRFHLPIVAVTNFLPYDCVYPDDYGIAYEAVSELIKAH